MPRSKNRHTRRAQKKRKKQRKKMRNNAIRRQVASQVAGTRGIRMCGRKCRYETEEHALGDGLRRYGTMLRPYRCPICKGWHITHQDKDSIRL